MEGYLLYYRGILKGYKKVFALMEEGCNDFACFKKQAYEDQKLRISLIESTEESEDRGMSSATMESMIDTSNLTVLWTRVYPEKDSKSFMIVTKSIGANGKTQTSKYQFRADSDKERNAWVTQINKFTKNLGQNVVESVPEEELKQMNIDQILEDIFTSFNNELFDQGNEMDQKYDKLQNLREKSSELKERIDELIQFQTGQKQFDKSKEGEDFDPNDLKTLQATLKEYSEVEASKDKLIDSLVRTAARQKSQLFKILENIAYQKLNEDSENFGKLKRRASRKIQIKQEIAQRMTLAKQSTVVAFEDGRYQSIVGESTTDVMNNMFDQMLAKDLIVEQYYGGELNSDDSAGTEMFLEDSDVADKFEQTFIEYDTFRDAMEKPYGSFERVEPRETFKTIEQLESQIVSDISEIRISLPVIKEPKLNLDMMWKLFKDLVGKDLSKFSLPVFLNEPTTILQKSAEMMFFTDLLTQASKEKDSLKRLILVSTWSASSQLLIIGRTAKPFNPLLGETFELVTPKYRFFAEQVSHHPPIECINCQGIGFELYQTIVSKMNFTGKAVQVTDEQPVFVDLKVPEGLEEQYSVSRPKMVVGNLVIGERFIEAQGSSVVMNATTNEHCTLEFLQGGWSNKTRNAITGSVCDSSGKCIWQLSGKYTDKIIATNTQTKETWTVFTMPPEFYPDNHKKQYGMNNFALQLNYITDSLSQKLPPTDSRLRPDLRAWENGDLDLAQSEKTRLEDNQRQRRNRLKEILKSKDSNNKVDMYNEQGFYNPRFFIKEEIQEKGKAKYIYRRKDNLYWQMREKMDWKEVPKIYEDDCPVFY